ncbi:MAG: MFS transporter [Deltaproteobacteria bacterium]|nr:MFS transporter [Deltaproteobacteria bacterium]
MKPARIDSPAYVRYVLALLFLVAIFNVCDRTIVGLLVEEIKRDIGLDDREVGLLMGAAYTVVHFGAAVPFGRIADRYSRKTVIALGLLAWSAMTVSAGLAQTSAQLILSRMGVGLGEAAGAAPSQSLIADYVVPGRRAKSLAVVTVGGTVGLGLGMLLGGWANELWGWRSAFLIAGVPGIALALLFYFTVDEPRRGQSEQRVDSGEMSSLPRVLATLVRLPAYCLLVTGGCFAGIATYGRSMWEPTFLRRVYGMDPGEVGTVYFLIYAVPMALGSLAGGWLGDRLARRDLRWHMWLSAIATGLALPFGLAFVLLPQSLLLGPVPLSFVMGAVSSFLMGIWVPQSMAMSVALSPLRMRTVAAAVWSSLYSLVGLGLGPYVVGELNVRFEPSSGVFGIRYSLASVMTALAIAAFFQLLAARRLLVDLARTRAMESDGGTEYGRA